MSSGASHPRLVPACPDTAITGFIVETSGVHVCGRTPIGLGTPRLRHNSISAAPRMHTLELLLRGALAGLAISIPVGPVNVLCISRTILKGRLTGIIAGLGAAAADTVYGSIAGFSITFIISFLVRQQFWIRLVGGALLIVIGIVYYFKKPRSLAEERRRKNSVHSEFAGAFFLNLTNPTTVLSFLAVLAGLHRS